MKSKSILTVALSLLMAASLFISCNYFDHRGFKKTGTGIYYKVDTPGNQDTTRITIDKIVAMDMKYGLKDSVFFDSKSRPGDMRFMIPEPRYEGDFYEALCLFSQGDSGTFILQAGPFFKQTIQRPTLPEGMNDSTELYFDFFIKKVTTIKDVDAETIEGFITQRNITVEPDADGIYFIEKVKGEGNMPQAGEYATVHFSVAMLDGQRLFSTRDAGDPVDFQIGSDFENPGFNKVVQRMTVGSVTEAVVPCAMAFGAQGIGQVVPPFTPLFYEIELLGTLTKEQVDKKQADAEAKRQADLEKKQKQESADLQKYIKDNKIKGETRASGLIYVETLAGTGRTPSKGQKVKVHYTGKLLDGTKFDSSVDRGQPIEFPLGQGQVIPGWEEGIALMKEGGKATLIVPSKLAYNESGAGGVIPPFASLVFDVELIQIVE